MLDRDVSGREPSRENRRRRLDPGTLSRYDFTLAAIPVAFLLAMALGRVLAISSRTALVVAAVVGALAVADGLFVHPPKSGS
ncbi:MAG: hypothetical protein ABEI96_08060 [Haloarculaceae archaeon]